ncbi:hypothetical protein M8C21_010209, partial [Ambrosia artemisiifolia]
GSIIHSYIPKGLSTHTEHHIPYNLQPPSKIQLWLDAIPEINEDTTVQELMKLLRGLCINILKETIIVKTMPLGMIPLLKVMMIQASHSSEELENVASEDEQEEVAVYKEPTMYDNLLKTLGSTSESIANAYKRRQRAEEGKSDSDEDEENDLESLSVSEEDEDVSENESESDALDANDVQGANKKN